jgi:hypothetical protein
MGLCNAVDSRLEKENLCHPSEHVTNSQQNKVIRRHEVEHEDSV